MKRKNLGGRPRISTAEHTRRGTVRPCRQPKKPAKLRSRSATQVAPRDYLAMADAYMAEVLSGTIVACRWTKLACERFQKMRNASSEAWVFNPEHVNRVCAFIERLPHVEGRWTSPTIQLAPWQVFVLAATYGFRRPDGGRLVTTVFFQV